MGKQLVITSDILLKVEYDLWEESEDRFYFEYDNYMILSKDEVNEGSYVIPLVHISQVAVMKDFIINMNDSRIIKEFKSLSDKEVWSKFWIYFDDDGLLSSRWHEYEENYCKNMISVWCENNGISFLMDI